MKKLLITFTVIGTVALGYGVVYAFSPQYGISDGLVGYWSMDTRHTKWTSATAATTLDKSGNGNTGTLTNMAQAKSPVAGKIGQGLKFDGSAQYVLTPSITLPSTFTWALWVKNTSTASVSIMSQVIQLAIYNHKVSFSMNTCRSCGVYSTTNIDNGLWHYVVVTDSGNSQSIYVDGSLEATSTLTLASTSGVFRIGAAGNPLGYFIGLLDDVRIYNRVLSATEITQLYNLGR